MSTTKRPTRNVTAGDLQLQDIGQITAAITVAIDRAIVDLWALEAERAELKAQRDELLEACRQLLDIAGGIHDGAERVRRYKLAQTAIARAEGT